MFIGGTDIEAETSILWPPDAESWLIWKDCDAGKDWGQEKKGTTEDEMAGWHHWHNGHGFGWTSRVGDGRGGLAYCGSWGRKELDTTERLNWTEPNLPVTSVCSVYSVLAKGRKERRKNREGRMVSTLLLKANDVSCSTSLCKGHSCWLPLVIIQTAKLLRHTKFHCRKTFF